MFDKEVMWQTVSEAARVGIAGHIRPDGDCVGSCLGLYNYITENYSCEVDVFIEELEEDFSFMRGSEKVITTFPDEKPYDVFFAIDCGDVERLGKAEKYLKKAVVSYCIDHHGTNIGFAGENHIVPSAAATAEVIYDLADPAKITKNSAECLYLGIVHDTGVFKHSNTTRHTMEVAGALLEYGVSSQKVIDETFY